MPISEWTNNISYANYLDINKLTTGGKYTKVTDDSKKNRDGCIGDSSTALSYTVTETPKKLKLGGAVKIKTNIASPSPLADLKPSDTEAYQEATAIVISGETPFTIDYTISNGKVTDVKVKAGSEGSGYVAGDIVDIPITFPSGVNETLKVKLKDTDLTNQIKTLPAIASDNTISRIDTGLSGTVKFKGGTLSIDVNLVNKDSGVDKGAKATLTLDSNGAKDPTYTITAAIKTDNRGTGYVAKEVLKILKDSIVLEDESGKTYISTEDIVFSPLLASNLQSLKLKHL